MKIALPRSAWAIVACGVLSSLLFSAPALAQVTTYYFENPGNGSWDTMTPNWALMLYGSPTTTYVDGSNSAAVLDNTQTNGLTVTLTYDATAQSLTFNGGNVVGGTTTESYILASSNANPGGPTFVNEILTLDGGASNNAVINSQFYNSVPGGVSSDNNVGNLSSRIETDIVSMHNGVVGDLTVNASGTAFGGGNSSFGDTSVRFEGTTTFNNLYIGGAAKGQTALGVNEAEFDTQGSLTAANNVFMTGNGASLSVGKATFDSTSTPISLTIGNLTINPNNVTHDPYTGLAYTRGTPNNPYSNFLVHIGAYTAQSGAVLNTITIAGNITGNGDLQFSAGNNSGGGITYVNGHNTYTGSTRWDGGTGQLVVLGQSDALPSGTDLIMYNNGGSLDINGNNVTVGSINASSISVSGQSFITNNGGDGVTPNILTIAGPNPADGSDGSFGLIIQDGASPIGITRTGTGQTILTNPANTFTGPISILGGTLGVSADRNLGMDSSQGLNPGSITINGGTFSLINNGSNGFTIDSGRQIYVGASVGTIKIGDGLTVTYNGGIADADTNHGALTLVAGANSGTPLGTGVLALGGTNTYTGPTTINGGTLYLKSNGSLSASSTVTVNAGGTLGGVGTAFGSVVLSGGAISPGNINAAPPTVGTLNVGSLTLGQGGSYIWKLQNSANESTGGAGSGWDLVSVNGGAGTTTISSTTGSPFTIDPISLAGISGFDNTMNHTWEIIASSSLAGTAFNPNLFTVNSSGFGAGNNGATFTVTTQNGALFLNYIAGTSPLIWKQGSGGPGAWNSSGGTDWSGGSWNNNRGATFNAGSGTVTLGTAITTQGVTFDINGYTIAGSGANTLSAPAIQVTNSSDTATISAQLVGNNLTTKGSGTLILTGPNSLTGTTNVAGGTLRVNSTSLPTDVSVQNGANLVFNQTTDGTYSHNITTAGTGAVSKLGAGTLTLTGTNSISTGVTIGGGALQVAADAELGSISGALTLAGGNLRVTSGTSPFTTSGLVSGVTATDTGGHQALPSPQAPMVIQRSISVGPTTGPASSGGIDTNGNSVRLQTTGSTAQIVLNNGSTFYKYGAGELDITGNAGSGATGFTRTGNTPGNIDVEQGTLSIGNVYEVTGINGGGAAGQFFFGPDATHSNGLTLENGTTFITSGRVTAASSPADCAFININGAATMELWRTGDDSGSNSVSPNFTKDPNAIGATNGTPMTINGAGGATGLNTSATLTIEHGGVAQGASGTITFTPRISVGSVTLNCPTTFQMVADAPVTNNGVTYGGADTNFRMVGQFNDNGYATTFYGGAGATQNFGSNGIVIADASGLGSHVSGNWTISNPQGTQGVQVSLQATDNTSFTSGNITVNPYGQLAFQTPGTLATTENYGIANQTLTIKGIGPEAPDYSVGDWFPGAIFVGGAFGSTFDPQVDFHGNVSLAGDATIGVNARRQTVTPAGGSPTTQVIGELILDGVITDNGFTLTKDVAGTLQILNGNSQMTGATVVKRGFIIVGDGNANISVHLGTGSLTLSDTSNLASENTQTNQALNLNNTGVTFENTAQSIANLSSSFVTWSGNGTAYKAQTLVTLNGASTGTVLTITEPGNTTFGTGGQSTNSIPEVAFIQGLGSVLLNSSGDGLTSGILTFTSSNTYLGGTTISGGKLALVTGTNSQGAAYTGSINGGSNLIVTGNGTTNGILGVMSTTNITNPANNNGTLGASGFGYTAYSTAWIQNGGTLSVDANFDASSMVDPNSTGIVALNVDNSNLSGVNGSSAFIGSIGNHTLSSTTLSAGAGGTYRLGGRGGVLTVSNSVVTGANNLIVGSTQPNGVGTVKFTAPQNFTGSTTVASGSTLQLAGSVSALSPATGYANVATQNGVDGFGLLDIQGTNQRVGNITGTGDTTLEVNSSALVNSVRQTTLTIGAGALLTIDPTDAAGNPLDSIDTGSNIVSTASSSKLQALLAMRGHSSASTASAPAVSGTASGALAGTLSGGGSVAAVPEPSSFVLCGLGAAAAGVLLAKRRRAGARR